MNTPTIRRLTPHAVTNFRPRLPMARQEDINLENVDREVIGFCAPEHLLGIITRPGVPFHDRWIDDGWARTVRLDAFGMAKGAQ